ncbi:tumor necrosis factor ligand superfamily member 14 isoform X1 [Pempheris klunzingeri]|uniref:tumor necrosis factor ligand superfamily member 14 isoform X1 n=1 Tax=Pempheris klunzingeri TaxID=3127111 RepID=UPI0039801E87
MAEGGYPSVYVVDSRATRPTVPPRLGQERRRTGVAQTLLILLVSLALCGMVIEACFIYRLYKHESANSELSSKLISGMSQLFTRLINIFRYLIHISDIVLRPHTDKDLHSPIMRPNLELVPSKPVAHLTDGQDVVHGSRIMAWSMDAEPLIYQMDYKDKKLVIQKDGFYNVYSKVSFLDSGTFHHSIQMETKRYVGKSIPLLASRKYSEVSRKFLQSNSFLGGVFHLNEGDALFVQLSNTSKILRHKSFENIFGAYMI